MRQWRNGVGNAPRHYAGTRSATGRVLSRTRSLTAAAIAVAMMATVAVTSLLPTYNAKADESRNDGAICTPTTEPLGDQTSGSGNDEGIATFVGGDMYVGGKKSGITSANNNNAPEGSYAVEAEGLTAVNGKLLLHPMKQAWNIWNEDKDGSFNRSRGFRWGIVGFGSQFRPKDGSTVLSVGGNSTNSELNWFGGAQGWTDDANQGSSWLGTGAGMALPARRMTITLTRTLLVIRPQCKAATLGRTVNSIPCTTWAATAKSTGIRATPLFPE